MNAIFWAMEGDSLPLTALLFLMNYTLVLQSFPIGWLLASLAAKCIFPKSLKGAYLYPGGTQTPHFMSN